MGEGNAAGGNGSTEDVAFDILHADALHPHEQVEDDRTAGIAEALRADGFIEEPIVAEQEHRVILDGHHRYHALLALGCRRIPAYLVDYESEDIQVTLWEGASLNAITKEDVLRAGLEGKPLPPKTSRHLFEMEMPVRKVALDELV